MLAHRVPEIQELAEWGHRRSERVTELVSEPRDPSVWVAEGRIQKDGAFQRKQNLQPGDIFEVKAQDLKPVGQSIVGNPAEGE
jgi:hypothetical protein